MPVKPAFPKAATKQTDAGAEAFVKYYLDAMNYARAAPDPTILPPLATSTCNSCDNLEKSARKFKADGTRIDGPALKVESIVFVVGETNFAQLMTKVRSTSAPLVDSSGTTVQARTASADYALRAFQLTWAGRWKVTAIGQG